MGIDKNLCLETLEKTLEKEASKYHKRKLIIGSLLLIFGALTFIFCIFKIDFVTHENNTSRISMGQFNYIISFWSVFGFVISLCLIALGDLAIYKAFNIDSDKLEKKIVDKAYKRIK